MLLTLGHVITSDVLAAKVLIPAHLVGHVIGRSAATIRRLQAQHKCHMKILNAEDSAASLIESYHDTERVLVLTYYGWPHTPGVFYPPPVPLSPMRSAAHGAVGAAGWPPHPVWYGMPAPSLEALPPATAAYPSATSAGAGASAYGQVDMSAVEYVLAAPPRVTGFPISGADHPSTPTSADVMARREAQSSATPPTGDE